MSEWNFGSLGTLWILHLCCVLFGGLYACITPGNYMLKCCGTYKWENMFNAHNCVHMYVLASNMVCLLASLQWHVLPWQMQATPRKSASMHSNSFYIRRARFFHFWTPTNFIKSAVARLFAMLFQSNFHQSTEQQPKPSKKNPTKAVGRHISFRYSYHINPFAM